MWHLHPLVLLKGGNRLSHAWGNKQPKSKLLRNEFIPSGKLKFTDITAEAGLDWKPQKGKREEADWENAIFEDFDNDGFRDLFITESAQGGTNYFNFPKKLQYRDGKGEGFDSGYSKLYMNDKSNKFKRIDTFENHLRVEDSWGVVSGDINNDGWLDLIVGSNTWKYPANNDWFDPKKQKIVMLKNQGLKEKSKKSNFINITLISKDCAITRAVVELKLSNDAKIRAVVDTSYGGY